MNDIDIEQRILAKLTDMYPNGLTYSEICSYIGLTKKNKSSVSQILSTLLLAGKLHKERKRYKLVSKPHRMETVTINSSKKLNATSTPNPQLIEGIFDATSLAKDRSFAFVRSTDKDYYIDSEDTLNAYHNDVVMIEASKSSRGEHGIVVRIVKRANENIPGDIAKVKNKWIFLPSNPKIHNWFNINELGTAKPGDKVMLTVTNWGDHNSGNLPCGNISEILGPSGDPQVELLAVIRQYQLPLEFPPEVLSEVQQMPLDIGKEEIKRRHDLRKLYTFTIDPASAKDFDDAISIEYTSNGGWRLWVHIADVAHYVGLNSLTFNEASERGNSFYFPKRVIPMIPERLSNQICSLRPDEDKLVMTVETEFDRNAKVRKQKIYEAVIRSDARLAYEEVDDYFGGKTSKLSPMLKNALDCGRNLSALLSKLRIENGYVYFDLPEIEYEYDNDGFVHRLGIAEETESHKLIENFMLVANEYTAKELAKKASTSIYRIHEDPDYDKIERLAYILDFYGIHFVEQENLNKTVQFLLSSLPNKDYHRVFDRIFLRSMKKAKYSTQHIRHFGLSLENYTHFTSPIRRLCDLVVHHLCKIHLLNIANTIVRKDQIVRWAAHASEQELQADSAERDIEKVYSATFMRDKVGESFTGLLISTNSSGAFIRLNELPVTAKLQKDQFGKGKWEYRDSEMRFVNTSSHESFELLDSVKVRIMEVSDDIYLELTGEKDSHIHYHGIKRNEKTNLKNRLRIKVDAKATRKNSVKHNRRKGRNRR